MRACVSTALMLALASCTLGPNFKPPAPPTGTAWQHGANQDVITSPMSNPDPLWWNGFHDKILTQLMNQAIAGNPNLQESELRVVSAHQNVITAEAAGLPTLNGTGSYMREQLGVKGILESNGAYKALNDLADASSPLNQNSIDPGLGTQISNEGPGLLNKISGPVNLYQYELSASWELDLFGRVRRAVEAANATAQAQAEAANDALVMLESQVAQAYFQLRGAQALAQQQDQAVQSAQASLNLTIDRQQRGLTSELDTDQARTQLATEQSQAQSYEKQIEQSIDQINDLTGQPPGTLDALLSKPAALPAAPSVIGIGLPSTLARRRPDIREAEAQLHEATAEVGVAVADFYPDISLMGDIGFRATDASYLTNWASNFYSAGPSISLPIFQGGKLKASLKMARVSQVSAALAYRGTVLNALREVEDALVALRTDQAALDATAASVQSADLSLYLSNNSYQNGLSSYLQVLDSERTDVSAHQQLAQSDLSVANDIVTLYTALGGGWQSTDVPVTPSPAPPPPVPGALDAVVP